MSANQWMMAFTAEVSCGVQLITRHRAPRVAAMLVVTAGSLLAASQALRPVVSIWLCGALAAVGGARLLAPGPALTMARRVPVPRWVPVFGRWAAAQAVLLPLSVAVVSIGVVPGGQPLLTAWGAVTLTVGFHAALGMALAPLVGAFGSGLAGCVLAAGAALREIGAAGGRWTGSAWIIGAAVLATPVLLGLASVIAVRGRR